MEEGSILGPLQYTLGHICISVILDIFKEEMDQNFQKKIDTLSCKYADDVTGYFAVDSEDMAKQATDLMIEHYHQYFTSCGLCLNEDKCVVMAI